MELHLPYKQMSFIFLKILVVRPIPILVKQTDIWQLWLESFFLEIQLFMYMYFPVMHAIIQQLKIFIFCHMIAMIFMMK